MMQALVDSAKQSTIELRGNGVRLDSQTSTEVRVDLGADGDLRFVSEGNLETADGRTVDSEELLKLAEQGKLVLTLTAYLGSAADVQHPQPELWTSGNIQQQRGRQLFPIATLEEKNLQLSGRYFDKNAWIFVDGKRASGAIEVGAKDEVVVRLEQLPDDGMHFLQVQSPHGFISNDFIFYAARDRVSALALQEKIDEPHSESGTIRRALKNPDKINDRIANGSTALAQAALWGQLSLVRELLEHGADAKVSNNDGNTPLHLAAFMCHEEVVRVLIEHGASLEHKNNRGEKPADVVRGAWSEELAEFYRQLGVSLSLPVDTPKLEASRPRMLEILTREEAEGERR